MNRREFLLASALAATAAVTRAGSTSMPTDPPPNKLPRWRGFNLIEMFDPHHPRDFKESDFAMLADWGFNFVRLPVSYLCWSSASDWNPGLNGAPARMMRCAL